MNTAVKQVAGGKRVPPQSIEAESTLLGLCLLNGKALEEVLDCLQPQDFYHPLNRTIYGIMRRLAEDNQPVDLVSVGHALMAEKKDGQGKEISYLAGLTDMIPFESQAKHLAGVISRCAKLRGLIALGLELQELAYSYGDIDSIMADAEQKLFALSGSKTGGPESLAEIMPQVLDGIKSRRGLPGGVTGVSTRLKEMDRMTAGLQPGDLVVLAGRPSMGKTALAFNMLANAAEDGVPGLAFSLEMGSVEIGERLLSRKTGVDSQRIRTGRLDDEEMSTIQWGCAALARVPVFIDPSPSLSVVDVRVRARRIHAKCGVGLIVVDYLQLMRGIYGGERNQEVAEISRGLKTLARELQVPVLALSQLNRGVEDRADKRPRLADLRESGAIEQDADVVLFIFRDDYYRDNSAKKGLATVIVSKHRKGPTGEFDLYFDKEYSRFTDYNKNFPRIPHLGDEPWKK